jgi:[protein-PII] uridylyltransferase
MSSSESSVFISSQPIVDIKQDIQQFHDELINKFKQNESVESLVEQRSDFIDHLLTSCWNDFVGAESKGLSLIATGGYGRAELHPFSDIDLLVLFEGDALNEHQVALEHFTTFLWDIGLKPGQCVRNIEDCIEQSNKDISVITNLMESRLITGSTDLFSQMLKAITPDKIWSSVDFFKEKVNEQQQRHSKFGHTAYNLEPNIKEGPGGLRDIQTIQWITQRYFGSNSLGELVNHAFITKNEYRSLIKGQSFLWKVRFALHIWQTGPKIDCYLITKKILLFF